MGGATATVPICSQELQPVDMSSSYLPVMLTQRGPEGTVQGLRASTPGRMLMMHPWKLLMRSCPTATCLGAVARKSFILRKRVGGFGGKIRPGAMNPLSGQRVGVSFDFQNLPKAFSTYSRILVLFGSHFVSLFLAQLRWLHTG